MEIRHGYAPRPVSFLELWETSGWRIKVYGIALEDGVPLDDLLRAAKSVTRERLPTPAIAPSRYGVGFMGVHRGRGSNLVFLDWWADENELRHHVFVSYPKAPEALTDVTSTSLSGCVWDLGLVAFERDAWIATALTDEPDLDRYLARRLEGSV